MDLNSTLSDDSRQKFQKSVKGLMLGRIIILTFFLAITFLFQLSEKKSFFIPMTNSLYYFIGLYYVVTIIYALLLKRVKDPRQFTFLQMVVDHLFVTGLIFFTGGRESFFPIAYVFSIIGCSFTFYKRGALFFASLSSLLYGFLLLLQLHGWVHPPGQSSYYEPSQIFYSLVIYLTTFYIVAILSSLLSEELKKKKRELVQKQIDYKQLETFNRNIIQSLDSSLLTIDLEGRINFLNRNAERVLGFNGETSGEVLIYDLFPNIRTVIGEVQTKADHSASGHQRYETLFINRHGEKLFLGFSISPLATADGALMGYTLIFQDITKFKEMEEQVKRYDKMSAINQLAAGMAHEIRNPLTSLSGSIQMLKSELTLEPHHQRLMDIILRESERLNSLVTDFLLFAQPPRTNKGLWEIGSLMEETIDLFMHSQDYHDGIKIVRPGVDPAIQAMVDPDQMKQVFWNLLINAAQAMNQEGELSVRLGNEERVVPEANPPSPSHRKVKAWVKISISDSGNGIPPQEKEKIFEPFYTTKDKGTGLGLSIVHRIIENHQGVIKVESDVGKGSTFTIFLPADGAKEQRIC